MFLLELASWILAGVLVLAVHAWWAGVRLQDVSRVSIGTTIGMAVLGGTLGLLDARVVPGRFGLQALTFAVLLAVLSSDAFRVTHRHA